MLAKAADLDDLEQLFRPIDSANTKLVQKLDCGDVSIADLCIVYDCRAHP